MLINTETMPAGKAPGVTSELGMGTAVWAGSGTGLCPVWERSRQPPCELLAGRNVPKGP